MLTAAPSLSFLSTQVNELAEGRVEYSYRMEPETAPPDVQKITKQMAIVAWQPGPNRVLMVPTEVRGAEGEEEREVGRGGEKRSGGVGASA